MSMMVIMLTIYNYNLLVTNPTFVRPLTCKCGQEASSAGSSSSGSNSAPLGFDEGGNVLNKFTLN